MPALTFVADKGPHASPLVGWQRQQHITRPNGSARQLPCKAAEGRIRPEHVLHRESHCLVPCIATQGHSFEMPKQRRPFVPGHAFGAVNDVIAGQRADRNAHHVFDSQLAADGEEFLLEPGEHLFAVVD